MVLSLSATVMAAFLAAADGNASAFPAFQPGPASGNSLDDDCWVQPLRLGLLDLVATGDVAKQVSTRHCFRRIDADAMRHVHGGITVGRTKAVHFSLFGERLGLGLQTIMVPGEGGAPDYLYTAPDLILPEKWALAMDKATYPALVISGAAILTTVIVQMLK